MNIFCDIVCRVRPADTSTKSRYFRSMSGRQMSDYVWERDMFTLSKPKRDVWQELPICHVCGMHKRTWTLFCSQMSPYMGNAWCNISRRRTNAFCLIKGKWLSTWVIFHIPLFMGQNGIKPRIINRQTSTHDILLIPTWNIISVGNQKLSKIL